MEEDTEEITTSNSGSGISSNDGPDGSAQSKSNTESESATETNPSNTDNASTKTYITGSKDSQHTEITELTDHSNSGTPGSADEEDSANEHNARSTSDRSPANLRTQSTSEQISHNPEESELGSRSSDRSKPKGKSKYNATALELCFPNNSLIDTDDYSSESRKG